MRAFAIFLLVISALCTQAQEITVAAAADLQFALNDIALRYEAKTGQQVKLTFGSSGNLFAAIQNGAPYDVFFSADTEYAKKLAASGIAVPDTLYEYAVGRLVLWVPQSSSLDVQRGMALLADAAVHKIAIANPHHAPYGHAAEEALKSAGVYDAVEGKLVLGENISQTAQFARSGNADVGLVSLSLVIAPPGKEASMPGKYWIIPQNLYSPLRQAAVVIKGKNEKAASQFLDFVKSGEGRGILKEYGFEAAQSRPD
ncbi:MAG: molybdate ABC transporter substrate-binding protein [Terriglobales bacterium]